MSKKTLAFMHTHIINDCVLSELKKLKAACGENLEVALFVNNENRAIKSDEILTQLEFEDFKIKALLCTKAVLERFKLPLNAFYERGVSVGECFWYNCDYSFYIMNEYFPNFDFYWQVQYDCFYNDKDYKSFFVPYSNDDSDLIAPYFAKCDENSEWCWIPDTQWLYESSEIYSCFWTALRMSAALINALYKQRLKQGEIFKQMKGKNKKWALCELFVATETKKLGFSASALKNNKTGLDEIDLNSKRLFEKPDFCLYHPLKGEFLKRLAESEKLKELEHFGGFVKFYAKKRFRHLQIWTRRFCYPIKDFFRDFVAKFGLKR